MQPEGIERAIHGTEGHLNAVLPGQPRQLRQRLPGSHVRQQDDGTPAFGQSRFELVETFDPDMPFHLRGSHAVEGKTGKEVGPGALEDLPNLRCEG